MLFCFAGGECDPRRARWRRVPPKESALEESATYGERAGGGCDLRRARWRRARPKESALEESAT